MNAITQVTLFLSVVFLLSLAIFKNRAGLRIMASSGDRSKRIVLAGVIIFITLMNSLVFPALGYSNPGFPGTGQDYRRRRYDFSNYHFAANSFLDRFRNDLPKSKVGFLHRYCNIDYGHNSCFIMFLLHRRLLG